MPTSVRQRSGILPQEVTLPIYPKIEHITRYALFFILAFTLYTLHFIPYTLYPTLYTLHSTQCTFPLLLRFPSFVPTQILPCQKPRTNQRRTKERPKNSESGNVRFIKIGISFTSLIPSLILPTDDRENSERGAHQLPTTPKCHFLRLLPNLVVFIPEKVVSIPKKVDSIPNKASSFWSILYGSARKILPPLHLTLYTLHQKNCYKKTFFLAHLVKKVYLCTKLPFYVLYRIKTNEYYAI